MNSNSRFLVFAISIFILACACPHHSAQTLTRLYFGLSSPAGEIAPADFDAFLDTCITPRFPQGLTRYAADGQWKDASGKIIKEKSVVVEIVHARDAESGKRLLEIVERYKRRFSQESVLKVEEHPAVEF